MRIAAQLERLAAPYVGGRLPIRVRAWDGSEAGPPGGPVVVLRSAAALRYLLWSPGELGLARAYVTGELDVDGDLASGLRQVWAALRDRPPSRGWSPVTALLGLKILAGLGVVGPPLSPPASEARVHGRRHTRQRDAAVISHHYDLSNRLYALLLDEHMAYSCGYWTDDRSDYSLANAQRDKLDLICRKLDLRPGARLLDVGCGWGALALHAASKYGAQVSGVTLSAQQLDLARQRVVLAGLGDRIELRHQDYRDLPRTERPGSYDAIAAIEMGEHVGARCYPGLLATLHRLLRPQGRLLVQQMSRGPGAPGGGAFIERYIAPDMHMRPVGETVALIERSGLEVRDVHGLREHYARTVACWLEVFEHRFDEVVDVVGLQYARVWRLYLAGGMLAFEQRRMGVDQILAVKATATGRSGMPATRAGWEPAASHLAG
ncbi:MAG TPA: cyclopropane-fatty-acyl-phospholipid synthase family protein [Mycobacteriales bacterium]|nr:cyclopropane-fatty-acyl-phospholipid synthase family protein [Mycobacteriales bacterium]